MPAAVDTNSIRFISKLQLSPRANLFNFLYQQEVFLSV